MTVQACISLLSLTPEQFTGTGTYVRELMRELATRDAVELEILCNDRTIDRFADMRIERVRIVRASGTVSGRSRILRAGSLAATLLRPRRPDRQSQEASRVVHYPLTLPIPALRRATVVTLHDVQHHELPQNFTRAERLWRSAAYDRAARGADIVITDSHHAREQIVERLRIDADRVLPVHLAVDHGRFSPDHGADDEALLDDLSLPERYLLYPASFWAHKNHRRLFAALARLDHVHVSLVLTGATFGRGRELDALAREHGVELRVRHLGHVADAAMPALYRRAEAVVFPSLFEGFGLAPLEAMAAGCPVASSRRASLAEVVGDCAVELDPDDVEQMAAAIERVCSDERLRAELRAAGVARAARFSWVASADAHLRAYDLAVVRAQAT